jgi:carbonic anhydrase
MAGSCPLQGIEKPIRRRLPPRIIPLRPKYHWVMRGVASLLDNNRQWAEGQIRRDPKFFERLCDLQTPEYLWIGCSDSRVPANEIVGLAPGELFVHRNVANVVALDDTNCSAVVQYAVEVLSVRHIIVCGHYGCGGVEAALSGSPLHGAAERWLQYIRDIRSVHATELEQLGDSVCRSRRLCELNVAAQVQSASRIPSIREAWHRGQSVAIHGWIYDLRDGLLRDLKVGISGGDWK